MTIQLFTLPMSTVLVQTSFLKFLSTSDPYCIVEVSSMESSDTYIQNGEEGMERGGQKGISFIFMAVYLSIFTCNLIEISHLQLPGLHP